MLYVPFIGSVILIVCFWIMGEVEVRTKGIVTFIWLVCAGGSLIPDLGILFALALTVLDIVLWWMTFGTMPGR